MRKINRKFVNINISLKFNVQLNFMHDICGGDHNKNRKTEWKNSILGVGPERNYSSLCMTYNLTDNNNILSIIYMYKPNKLCPYFSR